MIGDPHNGGRSVGRIETPDGLIWFEKPRPVFWENLFFGCKSPLTDFFKNAEAIFGLTIESNDSGVSGRSLLITEDRNFSESAFYNFGYLLGYSYAFGIQDLFKENVVPTKHGIQPIDAEIVLSAFSLPHESSLLPFKKTDFSRSGLGSIVNSKSDLTTQKIQQMLNGFISVLSEMRKCSRDMLHTLDRHIRPDIPIRVLLRGTADYRDWSDSKSRYLTEELVQLERGDIPYFFKFLSDSRVYFYGQDGIAKVTSNLSDQMQQGLLKLAVSPQNLISQERIDSLLLPAGCLHLMKTLVSPEFQGTIETTAGKAKVEAERLSISIFGQEFSTRRT